MDEDGKGPIDGLVGDPNNGLSWKIIEISKSPTTKTPKKAENAAKAANSSTSSSPAHKGQSNGAASSPQKKSKKMLYSFTLQPQHSDITPGSKLYKCDVCGSTYHHVFSLKRHFLRNHIAVKYISQSDINNCKINLLSEDRTSSSSDSDDKNCVSPVKSKDRKENDLVFSEGENPAMPGLFRCHLCKDMAFDAKKELVDHFDGHLNSAKTRFPCDKCSVVFSHKQALYRHLATHKGTKSFPCANCILQFDNKTAYIKHSATHTDKRTCKYCNKVLSTKANKCRHERIHQGLKPYPCRHCNLQFTQCCDLKEHVRKAHSMLYMICPDCPSLFTSKTSLNKHRMGKHNDDKLPPGSPPASVVPGKNEVAATPSSSSSPAKATGKAERQNKRPPSKPVFHRQVGKKRFSFNLGMLHHKRKIHPFAVRPRNKANKRTSYFTRSVRQRLFRKAKETVVVTEEEFYRSISSMVANNLLHYVDGKVADINLGGPFNFDEPADPSEVPSQTWSNYNFPPSFDIEKALTHRGQKVENHVLDDLKFPSAPHPNACVNNTNGDAPVNGEVALSSSDESEVEMPPFMCDYKKIDIEERKKMIGRKIQSVILCNVCKEKLPSEQLFEDHCNNNHPNVHCTYIEIEGGEDHAPDVPDDLRKHFLSPVGQYFSCAVPPPLSEKSTNHCTKCKMSFTEVSDLHQHIISCAGHIKPSSFSSRLPKKDVVRKIKRTMKTRINTALVKPKFAKHRSSNGVGRASIQKTPVKSPNPSAHLKTKPSVGRPKINLSILCPHCKECFRTKTLLSSHIGRCLKRLSLRKRKSLKDIPSLSTREMDLQVSASQSSLESSVPLPLPLRRADSQERLSPSLETIVNSIKEKLTADELSDTVPSFSWMEDEPLMSTPNSSSLLMTAHAFSANKSSDDGKFFVESSNQPDSSVVDKSVAKSSVNGGNYSFAIETNVALDASNYNGCTKPPSMIIRKLSSDEPIENSAEAVRDANNPDAEILDVPPVPVKKSIQKYKPKPNPYVKRRKRKSKHLKKIINKPKKIVMKRFETKTKELPKEPDNFITANESKIESQETSDDAVIDDNKPIILQATRFVPETEPTPYVQTSLPVQRFYNSSSEASTSTPVSSNRQNKQYLLDDDDRRGNLLCPHCLKYVHRLAMFHSHVSTCSENQRRVQEEANSKQLVIPKKDEVEESVISLWRHQSRQSKMMKEARDDPDDVKSFQTYTCDSCHRIFFSLFKLLQHRVVHKLQNSDDQATYSTGHTTDRPFPSRKDLSSPDFAAPHPLTLEHSNAPSIEIPNTSHHQSGPLSAPIRASTPSVPSLPVRLSLADITLHGKQGRSQPSPLPKLSASKLPSPSANSLANDKTTLLEPSREGPVNSHIASVINERGNAPKSQFSQITSKNLPGKMANAQSRKRGRPALVFKSKLLKKAKTTKSVLLGTTLKNHVPANPVVRTTGLKVKKLKKRPKSNASVLGNDTDTFVPVPKIKKKKIVSSFLAVEAEPNVLNETVNDSFSPVSIIKKRRKRKSLNIRKHEATFKKLATELRKANRAIAESSPVANVVEDPNNTISDSELSLDASSSTMASTCSEFSIMETSYDASSSNADNSCPLCGKVFTSLHYKKRHMVLIHRVAPSSLPPVAKGITLKLKKIKRKKKRMDLQRSALQRGCKQRPL